MDNAEKTPNDVTDLGPMTRLSDGNYKQYSSTSLFSITAGGYDGNGKKVYSFPSTDGGKSATAKFIVNSNVTVTVLTDRTVSSSNVTFKDSYEGGKVAATV